MAQRTFRSGLVAGALALALLASACGDSSDGSAGGGGGGGSDGGSENAGGGNEALDTTDCGELEYDADAPSGGTFNDYAFMADSGTNTSFDPGAVQTLNEFQITQAIFARCPKD